MPAVPPDLKISDCAFPPRSVQRARADLRRMRERMAALRSSQAFLADVREAAAEAAPSGLEATAWPTDIQELADKIVREEAGGRRSFEQPVRDRDRQLLLRGLPPCIQVDRNDPRYN